MAPEATLLPCIVHNVLLLGLAGVRASEPRQIKCSMQMMTFSHKNRVRKALNEALWGPMGGGWGCSYVGLQGVTSYCCFWLALQSCFKLPPQLPSLCSRWIDFMYGMPAG